jgi:tetratricopeptide (TPR) repeat protein
MKAQLLLAMGALSVQLMLSCSKQSEPPRTQNPTVNNEPQHKVLNLDPQALLNGIRKNLKLDPQNASLHGQAASLYDSVDDFKSFEREIQIAMRLDPGNPMDYYIAYAVYKRRHLREKQASALETALKLDPANPFGHYQKAGMSENDKDWQKALEEYRATQEFLQRVVQSDPHNFQNNRWMYVDKRGNPFDVTYEESHIADDISRIRRAMLDRK